MTDPYRPEQAAGGDWFYDLYAAAQEEAQSLHASYQILLGLDSMQQSIERTRAASSELNDEQKSWVEILADPEVADTAQRLRSAYAVAHAATSQLVAAKRGFATAEIAVRERLGLPVPVSGRTSTEEI